MNLKNYTIDEIMLFWKQILNNRDDYIEVFDIIRKDIDILTDGQMLKDVQKDMLRLAEGYGGCEKLKEYINDEGRSYFFDKYAIVNAPFYMYEAYVVNEECWCGLCIRNDIKFEFEYNELFYTTSYTCAHIKKMCDTEEKIREWYEKIIKIYDKQNETLYEVFKKMLKEDECFCKTCGIPDDNTAYALSDMFFMSDFHTCEYLKDKVTKVGIKEFYESNVKLQEKVPYDIFNEFIVTEKCWCLGECDRDNDEILVFFGCKTLDDLRVKLEGDDILSDEFYEKYFCSPNIREFYFNYGDLKEILKKK